MSQFSDFIQEHGISPEALIATSSALEKYSQADRDLQTKRETARKNKKTYEEMELAKPKGLGRGVSETIAKRAISGGSLSRLTRGKLVRAVNACLASQKKDAVDSRALFSDTLKTPTPQEASESESDSE